MVDGEDDLSALRRALEKRPAASTGELEEELGWNRHRIGSILRYLEDEVVSYEDGRERRHLLLGDEESEYLGLWVARQVIEGYLMSLRTFVEDLEDVGRLYRLLNPRKPELSLGLAGRLPLAREIPWAKEGEESWGDYRDRVRQLREIFTGAPR